MAVVSINENVLGALKAPAEIKDALRHFVDELRKQSGYNLVGVILYGGLAAGRYQYDRSDINIVVLLKDASGLRIREIAPVLRQAWKAAHLQPMILTESEVVRAADTFSTKFLDIKHNHVVLFGDDPFAALEIQRECLRLRVEQEFRNMALRMRRALVTFENEPYGLANVISRFCSTISVELSSLLYLKTGSWPESSNDYKALVAKAAGEFSLDEEALTKAYDYRGKKIDTDNVLHIYERLLAAVNKAADCADTMV